MLLDLGLVERREIPPSSQFRLIRENVAAQAIAELARSRDTALDRIGTAAAALPFQPVSVIVFGSFARGLADEHSDLDAIIVRPDDVDEDDDAWSTAIEQWRSDAQAITGNRIEILEVARHEVRTKLAGRAPLWRDVVRDGVVAMTTSIIAPDGGDVRRRRHLKDHLAITPFLPWRRPTGRYPATEREHRGGERAADEVVLGPFTSCRS